MKGRTIQKAVFTIVCALALVLIPVSLSWAQSSTPAVQQSQPERNDLNQDNKCNDTTTSPDTSREKPATSETEQKTTVKEETTTQEKSQYQQPSDTSRTRTTTESSSSSTERTSDQNSNSQEGLPATAGELPLLALIGCLSLAAGAGVRYFKHARSIR